MTQAYIQTKTLIARKLLENLVKSLDMSYPDMVAALMQLEKSLIKLVGYRDISALMKILGQHAVGEKVLLPLDEAA